MIKITSDKVISSFPKCPVTGAEQPPVNIGDVYFVLNHQEIQQINMLAKMLSKDTTQLPSVKERLKRMVVMQETGEKIHNFNIMNKVDYDEKKT